MSGDNSKYTAFFSKGDHAGEKQTNNSQAENFASFCYLQAKQQSFFYYSNSFHTHADLENKCLLFSV
jgi:hypothetical protein